MAERMLVEGTSTATEAADGTVTVNPVPDPTGVLHYSENALMESIFPTAFSESGVTPPATPGHVAPPASADRNRSSYLAATSRHRTVRHISGAPPPPSMRDCAQPAAV
jgi:hypothetical protein